MLEYLWTRHPVFSFLTIEHWGALDDLWIVGHFHLWKLGKEHERVCFIEVYSEGMRRKGIGSNCLDITSLLDFLLSHFSYTHPRGSLQGEFNLLRTRGLSSGRVQFASAIACRYLSYCHQCLLLTRGTAEISSVRICLLSIKEELPRHLFLGNAVHINSCLFLQRVFRILRCDFGARESWFCRYLQIKPGCAGSSS